MENTQNISQRSKVMKITDMLKFDSKSEASSSAGTNYNNITPPSSTFSAKDILVEYEDVAKELSDKVKTEKKKKSNHSNKDSEEEKPYDIFICYKETDESGERTVDSVLAKHRHCPE